jgi:L-threonylcarbamoyladenylate synthase
MRRVAILAGTAPNAIDMAADTLLSGGVIALPTDTVYGIAASLAHEPALERIFCIKGRQRDQPLPILLSSVNNLTNVAGDVDSDLLLLLDRYWPGPLTVIVPALQDLPALVTGPGHTVGVRIPNHPLAIEVIEKSGGALACTSANLSGQSPARDVAELTASVGEHLDLILDGGVTPGGVPSTVVAFDGVALRVLRDGAIPSEHLFATWDELKRGA